MFGRGCTKIRQLVLVLTLLLTICTLTAVADPITGVGGDLVPVQSVRLVSVPDDASIAIMGHFTRNGNAIPGTQFFLFWNHRIDAGLLRQGFGSSVDANGAQIAYILGPNSLVCFTISSDQFVIRSEEYCPQGEYEWIDYVFPHLPEDPEGEAAIAFF